MSPDLHPDGLEAVAAVIARAAGYEWPIDQPGVEADTGAVVFPHEIADMYRGDAAEVVTAYLSTVPMVYRDSYDDLCQAMQDVSHALRALLGVHPGPECECDARGMFEDDDPDYTCPQCRARAVLRAYEEA